MIIRQKQNGFKGAGDKPIEICTEGFEKIENKEIFTLIKLLYENEERIYPRSKGFQGGDKIRNAIFQLLEFNKSIDFVTDLANEHNQYKTIFPYDMGNWFRVSCDLCGGEVICKQCHNKYVWAEIIKAS